MDTRYNHEDKTEYRRTNAPQKRRKKHRGWKIVLRDIVLIGVALNVFALFHHVLPRKLAPVDTSRYAAAAIAATPSPDPAAQNGGEATPQPTATPVPGDFSAGFPAQDTGLNADYSYQTDQERIAIKRVQEDGVTYFVADVYVKNIDALKTAFARGTYGKNIYDFPINTAQQNQAVFAVSGDYYSARSQGIVIRNGQLYRDVPASDLCVLYQDGVLETMASDAFDLNAALARGVWQSWSFGPALLGKDGEALTEFDSKLTDRHPRSAIGYYAPGHYCFVIVDGRQKGYSVGMHLSELSTLFVKLGCKAAYNLDGGATAVMMFRGNIINQPYQGGRESGDIIFFT
ncbi:MAG TPA: phosphodiester glycosidase family protein [Clostridia bacterium]|nr:phosphodiester glycosidase family protein [Clostridia bacterium]